MHQCTLSLDQELRQLGYIEGAPRTIPPDVVAADIRIYRVQKCAECKARGCKVTPYHRGKSYRLVLTCNNPHCRNQTEA